MPCIPFIHVQLRGYSFLPQCITHIFVIAMLIKMNTFSLVSAINVFVLTQLTWGSVSKDCYRVSQLQERVKHDILLLLSNCTHYKYIMSRHSHKHQTINTWNTWIEVHLHKISQTLISLTRVFWSNIPLIREPSGMCKNRRDKQFTKKPPNLFGERFRIKRTSSSIQDGRRIWCHTQTHSASCLWSP